MKLQRIPSAKPLPEGKKQTVYDYPATIICAGPDRWELRRLRYILRRGVLCALRAMGDSVS